MNLKAFLFNYTIVSRCTKFAFQKYCKLVVNHILLLPWAKEDVEDTRTIEDKGLYIERAVLKSVGIINTINLLFFDMCHAAGIKRNTVRNVCVESVMQAFTVS